MQDDVKQHAKRWLGQTIADKYRVDAVLGIGGMGAVFRCHHTGLLRDVAVKLLHPAFMEDPNVSPRFDREAQSASRLEHPNCIRVMDYGTWTPSDDATDLAGKPVKYMVLELLSGEDLAEFLGAPMTAQRAMELGVQVLRGLEHAHARGVIHRDLKPENVFVTRDHEDKELLKLVDFGLAKVVSGEGSETRLTRTGMVFGTPHYMSPEQATGMPSDERTDIYAAGIMLWELLAGYPPFDGDDPISVIRQQVSTPLPPAPAHTPPELGALISAMTIKEPEQRTITAGQARTELERLLEQLRQGSGPTMAAAVADESMAATMAPTAAMAPTGSSAGLGQPSMAPAPASMAGAPSVMLPGMSQANLQAGAAGASMPSGAVGGSMMPAQFGDSAALPARRANRMTQMAHDLGRPVGLSGKAVLGIAGGIGAIVLVATIAAMAGGGNGDGELNADVAGEVVPADSPALAASMFSGVSDEELAELDKLIENNEDAAAQAKLDAMLAEDPDVGVLHLRRGLLFARQEGRIPDAVEAFDRGLELSPGAVEDDQLLQTILRVIRDDDAGPAGLELALTRLGERAHPYLLELVNRREDALNYIDRHRILATLEAADVQAVDKVFNRTLDLWQAGQAGNPCQVYLGALTEIEANPDPYYVGSLIRTRAPGGSKSGSKATSESGKGKLVTCPGLDKIRATLADAMAVRYPEAAKEKEVPPDYAKSRKRGGSGKKTRLRDIFK